MRVWILALLIGCGSPSGGRTVVTSTGIEIYVPITFAPGVAVLPADADTQIASMAKTLQGNPSLAQVAVVAFTAPDDAPTDAARRALGLQRAQHVLDAMIAHGVAAARLETRTEPGTPARIEFLVLRRVSR